MFISPQALIPFVMSLFVVFWSSSVAFVLENKKVLMRLAANSPWFPMNIHQHSQPASLCLDLRWGVCQAKKTLRREPLRAGNQPTEPSRVLGLRLKSDSIDVCLFKSTFAFLTGPAPKSSWLFTIALLATENQNSQASRTGNFPGPMGIRTNNTHSVIFIIKVLSKYELILARIGLSIVIPALQMGVPRFYYSEDRFWVHDKCT